MIAEVLKHGDHGGHGDIVPFSVTLEEKHRLDGIADKILDVAFNAHRQYGPGLLESALLIEDSVIVELKSCDKILPIHEAQLLTYLKFSDKKLGFILNFKNRMFKDGIRRLMR